MTAGTAGGAPAAVDPVPGRSWLRAGIWWLHLLLPLLGLWLLIAQPQFDVRYEHDLGHLVLVGAIAFVSLGLGLQILAEARRHDDARMVLVALAFLASAAFLLQHALATPNVFVPGANTGFMVAAPFGLLLAAGFAVASAVAFTPRSARVVLRWQGPLLAGLLGLAVVWAAVSLARLPPLDAPMDAESARGPLLLMTVLAIPLYALAAWRYWQAYRRRPAVVLLSVMTAFALLAEAMVNLTFARNWHASWWQWHVLLVLAFGFVAYSARVQYTREGTARGLFDAIGLEETVRRIRREHGEALEALVGLYQRRAAGEDLPTGPAVAQVAERFSLTEAQARVLERAAAALAGERRLFEYYLPPEVARALRTDPARAELGGEVAEVSVLYADLRGFTRFSERTDPATVVDVLNRYFGAAVPVLFAEGGTITAFIGDAVMAVFNAPVPQPDHALRAVRGALGIQDAVAALDGRAADWPLFGIGVTTGPALFGNVGGEQRSFTAIGDTVNLAARLQGHAGPGQVVVDRETALRLAGRARLRALGPLTVAGRVEPVEAFGVDGLIAAEIRLPEAADAKEIF